MFVNIMLADDHQILRDGLKSMIEKEADMKVAAEASNGYEAIELWKKHKPEIVVMDVTMPELNGFEATAGLLAINPSIRIIGLSMHKDKQYVIRMLKLGAKGFLLKNCAGLELVQAIRMVMMGKIYISQELVSTLLNDYQDQTRMPKAYDAQSEDNDLLTEKERKTLQLISEGKTHKEIAEYLHVSVKSVEAYRSSISEKLNVHTLAGLIKYAISHGITSVDYSE